MSALDNNPQSWNFSSPLNWSFKIQRAPAINYFVQRVNIPSVGLSGADAPSPSILIHEIGDHIVYEPLSIEFKLDENLQNFAEIHNWMKAIANEDNTPNPFTMLENNPPYLGYGIYSDLTLLKLDANRNPTLQINFIRAFPTKLGGLNFVTDSNGIEYLTTSVSFLYLKYKITLP